MLSSAAALLTAFWIILHEQVNRCSDFLLELNYATGQTTMLTILSPRGIFITGTDTGVGKTLVTSALVRCLSQRGIDVGVMKPIETGVSRSAKAQSDGARLRRAAGGHDSMAEVCPYVFRLPVAPLSAARAEGTTVRVATIIRAFRALRQKHALVVVEGVGGVHVPIMSSLNVSDLIYRMKLPAIVVGQSGLGGINHALLTLQALRRRKIPIVALVLISTSTATYKDRSRARTVDRESPSTACRGSGGRPSPLQPERESKLERRCGLPRGDRSDHEAGQVGPSPHYS